MVSAVEQNSFNTNNYLMDFVNHSSNVQQSKNSFDKFGKDSYTSSIPKKGSKMSLWKKLGIGLTTTLALGGIAVAVIVKKNSAIKQLAEHIDFSPAKTIEEAAEFARKNFGIKKFEIENLELANYSNEALTTASNAFKGKIKMPKVVTTIYSNNIKEDGMMNIEMAGGGELAYNLAAIENTLDRIKQTIPYMISASKDASFKKDYNWPEFYQILQKLDKKETLSLKDKLLLNEYCEFFIIEEKIGKFGCKPFKKVSPFRLAWHELGHIQHYYNVGKKTYYSYSDITYHFNDDFVDIPKNVIEHLNMSKQLGIDSNVSGYAVLGPKEYVPELFSYKLCGNEFSKGLMDLYYKYGGPKLP